MVTEIPTDKPLSPQHECCDLSLTFNFCCVGDWIRDNQEDSMEQNTQPSLSAFDEEGTHHPNNGLDVAVSPADVGANIATDESSSVTAIPYRGFDDCGEAHATSSSTSEATSVSGPFAGLAYRFRRIFSPRSTDMQQLLMKLQTQFEMLEADQKKYCRMRNEPSKLHLNANPLPPPPPHTLTLRGIMFVFRSVR